MKVLNSIAPFGLAIAVLSLCSVFWKIGTAQQERASAQELLAKINVESVIETRSIRVDETGQTRHTLCTGNWCVTDSAPPESFVTRGRSNSSPTREHGPFPTVDVAAIETAYKEQQKRRSDSSK